MISNLILMLKLLVREMKCKHIGLYGIVLAGAFSLCVAGCGNSDVNDISANSEETIATNEFTANESAMNDTLANDIGNQSNPDDYSQSSDVDTEIRNKLNDVMAENEDAFAWITVDGTDINGPVFQSWEEDDYYASHNRAAQRDSAGEMYIEMANIIDMCDFNTVIHGSGGENGIFSELINFENPDFFEANEEFTIYLADNKLKYEIWAVLERDNTSLIRDYDFTYSSGCKAFLNDVYGNKVMGKHIRGGWGDANENMFMVTLTVDNPDSDKQLIVIGALVEDEMGTINRVVME